MQGCTRYSLLQFHVFCAQITCITLHIYKVLLTILHACSLLDTDSLSQLCRQTNIQVFDLYSIRNDIERIFHCKEYSIGGFRARALVYRIDWARFSQSVISFLLIGWALQPRYQYMSPLCGGAPLSQHLLAQWLTSVPLHLVSVLVKGSVQHAWFRIEHSIFVRWGGY